MVLSVGLLTLSAGEGLATTVSFTDTNGFGTCSDWTVPNGVSGVRITATGAPGGTGRRNTGPNTWIPSGVGGAGGLVNASLSGLQAGQLLHVCVNVGSGGSGVDPDAGGGGVGGGASSVALSDQTPVLVAGGGGGGGDGGRLGADQGGGDAGLPAGVHGQDAIAQPGALGGGGGTQTAAGAAGAGDPTCASYCGAGHPGTGFANGAPGTGGTGGQIVTITGGGGGGGGGGYYAGGGGGSGQTPCTNCGHSGGAGGGGGSDFCATVLSAGTLSGCGATGNSNNTPSVVFTYPVGPPSVSIATPSNGASYTQGQAVGSSFSCDDGAGGSWLASCVDQSGRASGSALDTSTLGSHTLTVTATTRDGLTSTASATYSVAPAGGGGGTGGSGGGGGTGGSGGSGGSGGGAFPGLKVRPGTFTVKNGTVKLTVACPPGQFAQCVGIDTLTTLKATTVAVKHKHKLMLGSARFSIPAGHMKTLTLRLTKQALKLLAKKRRLRALETVVAHDPTGQAKTTQTTITIKLLAKHRKPALDFVL